MSAFESGHRLDESQRLLMTQSDPSDVVGWTSRPSVSPLNKIYSCVAFSIYVHENEFSFLNFILVVAAKRAPISEIAMPTLGFQSDGRQSRPKEYPHVT
jgi:hypothetical protein